MDAKFFRPNRRDPCCFFVDRRGGKNGCYNNFTTSKTQVVPVGEGTIFILWLGLSNTFF